ncbi:MULTISPECIES: dTDP-4-dehydrorhamnose reductase [Methylobacterium]|uniref:dTDP-4-dehydrorhamnose reductase n=1 Tax=Methylobacterium bullatum TaxID=570505 RepID=A0A679JFY9_9HYPH|nr:MULTISPECIES: dTDP-4-dehydrorhamnose reductase [Methylobacterium]KQO51842.1 NAD(P)-dependent oxidoreductase [Methylobacterium sp. Leaf85]KQP53161.1 NAD(P)-dependent oxidoreductase [Methylobacterium sp. Leaf106]MBD8903598.1 NAD(P)-dependent oxidoreductase [Methylobacterium bullatum]CAA2107810.1 dTDP-4-dehydrorhamnose reductase [Methylobacterium bullatum]GJD39228.1 dTDP-4-dehydrorhamnose reductase [Methylobacterium bullatum]
MDILILGGAGQVGTELQASRHWGAGVTLVAPTRTELDVTDATAVARIFTERTIGAVVNAAAYTAVDKAESEVVEAWRLNALAPAILAAETARRGIPLVHVSTDYVFDGAASGAYAPDAPIRPTSVYGASKAAGEMAVRTANPRHAILRTAWVVSPHRGNFVKTMLRLAAERDALNVVNDQRGCPTSAADLAAALADIALRLSADSDAPTGTHHFVNAGATTWHGFAQAIVAGSAARGGRSVPVNGIPTSAYPTPARRPANSELSTESLTKAYGLAPRPWQAALDDILDRLVGPAHHSAEAQS